MNPTFLGLAAAAALSLGSASPAVAQKLTSSYDFVDSLQASYHWDSFFEPVSLEGIAGPTTTDADGQDGVTVPVRRFAAGQGFASEAPYGAETIVAYFNIDTPDPNPVADGDLVKLVDLSPTSTPLVADVYLEDGHLAYRKDDGTFARAASPTAIGANTWFQLAVTFEFDGAHVYRGSTEEFLVDSSDLQNKDEPEFALFGDLAASGEIARLRTWMAGLDVSQIAQLAPLDVDGPSVELTDSWSSVAEGGTRWIGPDSFVYGTLTDDGSISDVDFEQYRASGGAPVYNATGFIEGTSSEPGFNTVETDFHLDVGNRMFANGESGVLRVIASDRRGNTTETDFPFTFDDRAPAGFSLDPIGETTNRKPVASGKATVGPRDEPSVYLNLCKGDKCDGTRGDYVGYARAEIKDGKFSTSGWKRWDDASDREVAMGDQPNGDYVVEAFHSDAVANESTAKQQLTIVDPKPVVVTPPPVVTPPVVVTPPAPTLQQLMQRVMQDVVVTLRRARLAALVRSGKIALPAEVNRLGTVIYQLFLWQAPSKVDPKAKAAAAKRKKAKKKATTLIGAGRKAFRTPGAGSVSVVLSKSGKARLRRAKKAKIVVRQIFVPTTGPAVSRDAVVNVKR